MTPAIVMIAILSCTFLGIAFAIGDAIGQARGEREATLRWQEVLVEQGRGEWRIRQGKISFEWKSESEEPTEEEDVI